MQILSPKLNLLIQSTLVNTNTDKEYNRIRSTILDSPAHNMAKCLQTPVNTNRVKTNYRIISTVFGSPSRLFNTEYIG